jgi:hypothetical protein
LSFGDILFIILIGLLIYVLITVTSRKK